MTFIDETRVLLRYNLPTAEVVTDFYDQVKSLSSGYARCVVRLSMGGVVPSFVIARTGS